MKKRSHFKQLLVIMLSIVVLLGVLAYAYDTMRDKDTNMEHQEQVTPTNEEAELTPTPTQEESKEPTLNDEDKDASSSEGNTVGENIAEHNDPASDTTVTGDSQDQEDTALPVSNANHEDLVLAFAGDINFNETSKPIARYDREKKGILGGLSSELVEEMNAADIMMLNNEFAYSTRGTRIKEKSYTFRADPSRVDILHEMGVDIVSLANNHALDYGQDALLDTFTTLDAAEIDYIGAGEDRDRAKAPVYYTIKDKTIAYVAASRVIYAMDWYATDTRPGMVGTYDPTQFLETIQEAAANSDYVVAYVHWGVEYNNYPVDYQKTMAKQYIDAGADIVVGCHPHVMQGIEIYKGKIIAYSLGNFWFNNATRESGLLKIFIDSKDQMKAQLLPVMAKETYSYLLEEERDRKAYYDFLEEISFDVSFDAKGFIDAK